MNVYYALGYIIRPIMVAGFYCYNKLTNTPRSRVVLLNQHQQVLLVRNWGSRKWGLPGGGVMKAESPLAAARRELFEETGLQVASERLSYLTTLRISYVTPLYLLRCHTAELPPQPYRPHEIMAAEWFTLDQLPTQLSKSVPLALEALTDRT